MDHRPRAQGIRLLASACYFPLVALVVLLVGRFSDIRLLRFHAYQSLLGLTLVVAFLLVGGVFSTVTLWAPVGGFWFDVLIGLAYVAVLCGYVALVGHAGWVAYQGQYTRFPGLTDWVWQCVHPKAKRSRSGRKRRPRAIPTGSSVSGAMPFSSAVVPGLASE